MLDDFEVLPKLLHFYSYSNLALFISIKGYDL